MSMPNFLIIGAAKSGTTSLHYYLGQHPGIYMAARKDTFFFCFFEKEPNFSGPGDQEWYREWAVTRLEDYQALFEGHSGETAIGEACAEYLYDEEAPANIKSLVPNAKLVVVLRNPVERAYSNFMHLVRDGYEPVCDFSQALLLEEARRQENWRPMWHYRARGFYSQQIERYLRLFDKSQIRVYLHEDLASTPGSLFRDLFGFLGVDADFRPDTSMKHNVSGIPRSRTLLDAIMKPNPLKTIMKPLIPATCRNLAKKVLTGTKVNLRRFPIPSELRQTLVAQYRADILRLECLIDRDLSHWLT